MKLMLHIMQLNYRGKIFSNYTHIYTKGKVHETGYNGTDHKHTELDATAIGSRLSCCFSATTKPADLLSKIPDGTDIEILSNPVPQSWVMCGTSLTFFFIETGDRGGAGRTHPHQQTV